MSRLCDKIWLLIAITTIIPGNLIQREVFRIYILNNKATQGLRGKACSIIKSSLLFLPTNKSQPFPNVRYVGKPGGASKLESVILRRHCYYIPVVQLHVVLLSLTILRSTHVLTVAKGRPCKKYICERRWPIVFAQTLWETGYNAFLTATRHLCWIEPCFRFSNFFHWIREKLPPGPIHNSVPYQPVPALSYYTLVMI